MSDPQALVDLLQQLASSLPPGQVAQLADLLDAGVGPDAAGRTKAAGLVPNPAFRGAVANLWSAWADEPETPPAALALSLRAASLTSERLRAATSLEVVWTGPTSHEVPVRQSAQVLEQLIQKARKQLVLVSFAAYKVAEVNAALTAAAARGVAVHLVLETEADSKGALNKDAADAFDALQGAATFWVWPKTKRPEGGAVLHAKSAICDTSAALVTSANLTGKALARNMELGLLVTGGPVPRRLADHFTALMERGELQEVT